MSIALKSDTKESLADFDQETNGISGPSSDSPRWQNVLDTVVSSIVAIKFATVRHFDTERAGYGVATGFVVDKEKGLILTNRHVVRPGPVTAEAVFLDHEEVRLYPVYRDPVHDFGFYRFEPKDVKFMQVTEIPLAPDEARIGKEIRIIGNDAGEKLSILSGTIARLDRHAPSYGDDKYNDFNTVYYQAASGTSGGSSGSPVVDINGRAIALVAGGKKKAASSFYLPLHKPLKALRHLQKGEKIPRGTIQTIFRHCPYDEVHRLGLREETEKELRSSMPLETGLLVVDQVVPMGPAHDILEPGDILLKIDSKPITTFLPLELMLDGNLGKTLSFEVERGGTPHKLEMKIQDLDTITPHTLLEMGGGVMHPLSYQQAKNQRLPVGAVYIASEGYSFGAAGVQRGSIITSVANQPTPDLETFQNILSQFPDHSRVPIRYFSVTDRHSERLSVLKVDRLWHPMLFWERNDEKGDWDIRPCPVANNRRYLPQPSGAIPVTGSGIANSVLSSLVLVNFTVPFVVDGGANDTYLGTGLIVDLERGLVVVDQNTVPMALGDLTITFGATIEVPGEVVFIHPVHNFAVVKYDPVMILGKGFTAAKFSKEQLSQGEDTIFVGLTRKFQPIWLNTVISRVEELFVAEGRPPRFRAINEDVYQTEKIPSCVGGVLVDEEGLVTALWASYSSSDRKDPTEVVDFFRGMPIDLISEIVDQIKQGNTAKYRSLEVEWWPIALSQARDVGLTSEWINKMQQKGRRAILNVRRLVAQTSASNQLKTGDILLSVNGDVCSTFREVELASRDSEKVTIKVLRNMKEEDVEVETVLLAGVGTNKVVCWAGAILQDTHRPVAQLGFLSPGVYCSRWYYGSPAHKYSLRAAHWIVEVNGTSTPDLDSFLKVVSKLKVDDFVRLKIKGMQDRVSVTTLKLDLLYWPTWVLYRKGKDWIFEDSPSE